MTMLKVLAILSNFTVIAFIGLRTLNAQCFNASDVNLSIAALVFSMIVEIIYIRRR